MIDSSPAGVTTFVFVSGSNGGPIRADELALRGHRTVNVELPGHAPGAGQLRPSYQAPQDVQALNCEPSPMAGITLDDYADHVANVVRRVAPHGPVILVGFGLGGATLSRVGNLAPDLIARLVYSSAFCCTGLPSVAAYLGTPEGRDSALRRLPLSVASGLTAAPAVIGGIRVNWRSADRQFLAAARAMLMADGSDAELLAALNTMWPDEARDPSIAEARGDRDSWGRIPRSYLRFSLDRVIPVALQDRMIAEADALTPDNRFDVHTLPTTHLPSPASWPAVLDVLDGLARR